MPRPASDVTCAIREAFERADGGTLTVLSLTRSLAGLSASSPADVAMVRWTVAGMLRRGEIARVGTVKGGRRGRPEAAYRSARTLQMLAQQHGAQIPSLSRADRQAAAIQQLALAWS